METVAKINAAAACPNCSTKTLKVEPITVRSLVKPEIVERVRDETYRFCPSNTCDIVYFSAQDPERRFFRADMKVRVGQKETSGSIQVCYCFDWTTDDIAQDLRDTGETTVPDRIKRLIQLGFCRCETMNPHGTCCLGEVNRAVKEARTKYARSASEVDLRDDRTIREANSQISEINPASNKPTRAAGIAVLGAVFTAIIGSACCWLPLLLIALGFSAAGVSRAFERFQPILIVIAFALLGSAWALSYRSTLYRLWARATGKPACGTHDESCCSIDSKGDSSVLFNSLQGDSTMSGKKHSCCDIDPNSSLADAECSKAETSTDRPSRRGISTPRMSRLMLWIATGLIPLFVFFPYWSGLIFGSGVGFNPFLISKNGDAGGGGCCAVSQTKAISPVSTTVSDNSIVLKLEGLTCEGCAATVRQALSRARDVSDVQVDFQNSRAVIIPKTRTALSAEDLVKVVEKTGYHAKIEETTRK
jgi:copper chaperone CopZ